MRRDQSAQLDRGGSCLLGPCRDGSLPVAKAHNGSLDRRQRWAPLPLLHHGFKRKRRQDHLLSFDPSMGCQFQAALVPRAACIASDLDQQNRHRSPSPLGRLASEGALRPDPLALLPTRMLDRPAGASGKSCLAGPHPATDRTTQTRASQPEPDPAAPSNNPGLNASINHASP